MSLNRKSVGLRIATLGLLAGLLCGFAATSPAEDEVIVSRVEGPATILSVKPNGAAVAKGDVLCELDSADLRDKLNTQQLLTRAAEASLKNARLNREVAELDVEEQTEAGKQDVDTAKRKVAVAQATVELKKKLYDEAVKKKKSEGERLGAEKDVKQAELTLAETKRDLSTLERITVPTRQRESRAELDRTRGEEITVKTAWEAEAAKEKKIIGQIAACKIVAEVAGRLVYAVDPAADPIEEGATVNERQKLFVIRADASDAKPKK